MDDSVKAQSSAAPPDAGGHLGSRTRPEDLLRPSDPTADESRKPELSGDVADGGKGAGGSVVSFALYGTLMAVVVGAFLYVYGPG